MTENSKIDTNSKQDIAAVSDAETTSAPMGQGGTFISLRIKNFRYLVTGSMFSFGIQWIQSVILNWLVYDITGSGTMLGTINLVASFSSFAMLFVTGIMVDYFNRRKLMLTETAIVFVATIGLGLLLVKGYSYVWLVIIFTLVCGMVQTLDSTLRQVLIFDLVPRSQTPSAMALNQTGWSLMRVLGPSIGGFFLVWFGAGRSLLVQAAIWILVAITILMMKIPDKKIERVRSSPLQNMKDGLGFIFHEPVTRIFTLIGIVMPILAIPIFVILPPIYAVQVFGDTSGRVLGFLMAAVGVGGIIGGVVMTYLKRFERWGLIQVASFFLLSITLLGFAFCKSLPVALATMVLAGFFEVIFLTTNMTLIQLSIPDKLRARVTAAVSLTWILSPVGSMMAGAGADLLGPKNITIVLSAVGAVVAILIYMCSPTVRKYRLSQNMGAK